VPHPHAVQSPSRPVVQSHTIPVSSSPSSHLHQSQNQTLLNAARCWHWALSTAHTAPRPRWPFEGSGLDELGKVGCAFFACLSIMPHSAAEVTPPRPCTVPCQRTLAPTKCGARRSVWGSGCWILCVAVDGEAGGGEMYE
jgi:hypothetical protein